MPRLQFIHQFAHDGLHALHPFRTKCIGTNGQGYPKFSRHRPKLTEYVIGHGGILSKAADHNGFRAIELHLADLGMGRSIDDDEHTADTRRSTIG